MKNSKKGSLVRSEGPHSEAEPIASMRHQPPLENKSSTDAVRRALEHQFGPSVRSEYPLGKNDGVILMLEVPGSNEFVRGEFFPPSDERDFFEAVSPLISFRLCAAIMGCTKKTLYSRAKYMASSIKIGGRWFFKKDPLYRVDLADDGELPSRKEILEDRRRRAESGEVLRGGRHSNHCSKEHLGRCSSRRPPLTPDERARNRRRILDDLGK